MVKTTTDNNFHKFMIVFFICTMCTVLNYIEVSSRKTEGLGAIGDGLQMLFVIVMCIGALIGVLAYGYVGAITGVILTPIILYMFFMMFIHSTKKSLKKNFHKNPNIPPNTSKFLVK